MKKKDYTIETLLFCLLLAILGSLVSCQSSSSASIMKQNLDRHAKSDLIDTTHICVDLTHQSCDGNCECDGLGCDSALVHVKIPQQFIKMLNVTPDCKISVMYIASDGEEYAYDNMTSEEFHDIFGFTISTEE